MYNLLEYSKNYRKTTGSSYNYFRDEFSDGNIPAANAFNNIRVVNWSAFQYKSKLLGNTYDVNSTIDHPAGGGARPVNPNYDANRSGRK